MVQIFITDVSRMQAGLAAFTTQKRTKEICIRSDWCIRMQHHRHAFQRFFETDLPVTAHCLPACQVVALPMAAIICLSHHH